MKVVVGMSGGVDSSVSAYLLKEKGYEVIGLFMRNWDSSINNDINGNPNLNVNICPQEQDYNDAKGVCDKLGIKLYRIDFVKEYWDNVFTYFLEELKKGRTPNPDVMCNKYIKFDLFVKKAMELGADFVATGHYAKVVDGNLYKALDKNKDQSYFLAYVNKDIFKKVIFPLANMTKPEVRKIAKKLNLDTASKKDSTGICFIGERNFRKFLSNYLPNQEGDIININTKQKVGRHIGLMYYTIGQRRGLNLGGEHSRSYVVSKDLEHNILYVANGDENKYLYSTRAIISDFNFLSDLKLDKCSAKFRYRQEDVNCQILNISNNTIDIVYDKTRAVTPGQFCVLYDNDKCLGGGIIDKVFE